MVGDLPPGGHHGSDDRPALHSTPLPPWMRDRTPPPQSQSATGEPLHAPAAQLTAAGRHCWVYPPRESTFVPKAGLLLEWRRGEEGYEGLVVYMADLAQGSPLTQVQEWIAARHLRPTR